MSLVRWDPFADMAQLREQMNRLFEQSLTRYHEPAAGQFWAPAVDIHETEHDIVLSMDVAGVKPGEIDIQISGDTLTIKGERKAEHEEKSRKTVRIERSYGAFQRSFTLGLPIEQNQVHASYTDGVLEIRLPKAEEIKPKQVKVEVGAEKEITG